MHRPRGWEHMLLCKVERVSADLGVPLAPSKTDGLSTVISFLGINIDTVDMECHLSDNELQALQAEVGRVTRLK